MTFSQLHVHTGHSGSSSLHLEEAVEKASALGQDALAVTDVFHLGSAVRLRRLCAAAGIKAITGMDARFTLTKGHELFPSRTSTLTLLSTRHGGWSSLVAIHNHVHSDPSAEPLLTPDVLARHSAGLTVLTGGAGGPLSLAAERGDEKGAGQILRILTDAVGTDAVKIAVSGLESEPVWDLLCTLSDRSGVQLAAVQLVEYLDENQSLTREAFCAARAGVRLDDPDRPRPGSAPAFLATAADMASRRPGDRRWLRALEETADIASSAVNTMPSTRVRVPAADGPADKALRELVYAKAEDLTAMDAEVKARLDLELEAISDAGTAAAFLVVSETHDWMGAESILSNSRASANCSLVLHCLGVAETNPLDKDLPFDRFMADTREGMPSINLDVQAGSRADVDAFLASEYGSDKVARVAAFPRIRTRRAVRDAARTLGEKETGRKLLEDAGPETTVADLLAEPDLTPSEHEVLELASVIEGAPGSQAVDAGSVIIAGEPLQNLVPVRPAADGGLPVICLNADDVQSLGFLKMEFQGLPVLERTARTLEAVPELAADPVAAAGIIADSAGELTDPRVRAAWDLLARGNTEGVFLMSNPENLEYARLAAPRSLDDLAALTALNRPGFTDHEVLREYTERTEGPESCARYTASPAEQDALHAVLGRTGGLILFQEQIMALAMTFAGASGEEADRWRRTLQEADPDEVYPVREAFLTGARSALEPGTAARVFDAMERAGQTAFSGSHAYAQSRLTFVDAWLAANHPEQFREAHTRDRRR